MKLPLDERLGRLGDWFHRRNRRPLVGFSLGSCYPLRRYANSVRRIPGGAVSPQDIVVADYLDDSDRLFELHEEAGGDMVWSAAPFWGIPWVEAALGCGVVADHEAGSTRSVPPPGFALNPVVPEFSETNPWVAKMLEFVPALAERSGGRYPVGVTLMRGISDLLSALYGAQEFVYRMHDRPDEVHEVVERLTAFWIAFGRCLLDRLPLFHGGTGSFQYALWCPGKMVWYQEDAVALLSPSLYERFVYPADLRIASAFEHTAVHLHPTRFIPTQHLVRSDTSVIELHIDHDGPRAETLFAHYTAVLASKPLLVWGDVSAADLDFLLTRLPHPGLAINLLVSSVEEAHAVYERVQR
jgi:hypothetical protein